ncbi:MAG: UDP-N-acetylmuramoyl-L-alanyl-D-glutamate--2,6-diaminopimelate ligase [Acidimicrobiia bacterium]|nr:UDP-N-acetylmuramoyl-L-alanyl-D-glutamate--2,6-diaminopimelate ligase [Acidimicrobiia bacterium]
MSSHPISVGDLALLTGGDVTGERGVEITDVVHDSRSAGPGALFVAIRGLQTDGHRFVETAIANGAAAVCVEEPAAGCGVPQLVVDNTRANLGLLAAEVHGRPSSTLRVVGITGTNGKTTVAHLLESIASTAGVVAGRIGTTGASVAGKELPLARTTPEASNLQRLLASMVEAGADVVAAEVSSHALTLGRVDAVQFELAAFTNLSQDHLDFHADMDDYFSAKALLFDSHRTRRAVINCEDPWGERLAGMIDVPFLAVGELVKAADIVLEASATRFRLVTLQGEAQVVLPLAGEFNVSNALVAAGCAIELGIDLGRVVAGLEAVDQIPGRYEIVQGPEPFLVVVDYAHTPEGVESVVATARATCKGSIAVVLGAGGDRDRSKRPAMGKAASAADRFFLTSDNPRSESPAEIIEAVRAGVETASVELVVEADRRTAIRLALESAGPGDTVLVLGKGHEQGQEIDGRILEFDDRKVVAEEIALMEEAPCSPC